MGGSTTLDCFSTFATFFVVGVALGSLPSMILLNKHFPTLCGEKYDVAQVHLAFKSVIFVLIRKMLQKNEKKNFLLFSL
jgi:hypothetical protein